MTTQAELEAGLVAQEQASALHTITVVKAIVDNRLSLHDIDFDTLAANVNAINTLLDGDPDSAGYQAFAALTTKLNTVEATAGNNASAISALQSALTSQIATVNSRIDDVESASRTAREALDARISTLSDQYTSHVATQLAKDNAQNTSLDDHKLRIEALEAAKALHVSRLDFLETDNTANKSAIAQLVTTVAAQSEALQLEQQRAELAEAALRAELVTERARVDALESSNAAQPNRTEIVQANEASSMAFVDALWASAGIAMPSGLALPNGTVSA